MPKEYVGQAPQVDGSVTVKWGRDSAEVQLTVTGPVGWRGELILSDSAIDPDNALDWHVSLKQRFEVNRLIRLLRQARDQAFGKDE